MKFIDITSYVYSWLTAQSTLNKMSDAVLTLVASWYRNEFRDVMNNILPRRTVRFVHDTWIKDVTNETGASSRRYF